MYDITTLAEDIEIAVITTPEEYEKMGQYLVDCKVMDKEVHKEHDTGIDLANKTHKHLTAMRKLKLDLIGKLETAIKSKRLVYKTAQDKIAEEKQRKLEEAEAKRVADEKAVILAAAEAAETPEEKEALEDQADEVVERVVVAPVVVAEKTKVASGGSTRWVKDIEVVIQDEKEVCRAVCEGSVPISVVEIKVSKLKAYAKAVELAPGKYRGFTVSKKDREIMRS